MGERWSVEKIEQSEQRPAKVVMVRYRKQLHRFTLMGVTLSPAQFREELAEQCRNRFGAGVLLDESAGEYRYEHL